MFVLVVRATVFDPVDFDTDSDEEDCDVDPECRDDAVACWPAVGGVELDNAVFDCTDNALVESIYVHIGSRTVPGLAGCFELVAVLEPGVDRLFVWAGAANGVDRSVLVVFEFPFDVVAISDVGMLISSGVETGGTEALTCGVVCSVSSVVVVKLDDSGLLVLTRAELEADTRGWLVFGCPVVVRMSGGGDLFVLIGLTNEEAVDSAGEEAAVGNSDEKSELGNAVGEVELGNAVGEVEVAKSGEDAEVGNAGGNAGEEAEVGNAGEVCVVKGSSLTVGGLLAIREVESENTLGVET